MSPLVECVPNFSEGKNPEIIDAIHRAISGVEGVDPLHVDADPDHNRCVITFAGAPDAVIEAAFRGCRTASRLIDLRTHRGVHPRIGAADVIPLIPLRNITVEACVGLARTLAERIGRELSIPVYLYGKAAQTPERRELASIRRGGFEYLLKSLPSDSARHPDFGPAQVHPTAGAVAVGVRDILIAYNFYLDTDDVAVARAVARAIREKDGGLPSVRSIGLFIPHKNRAQVSCNLLDYRTTSLPRVFDRVQEEARRHGASVIETELIGLAPLEAALEAANRYLLTDQFRPDRILEWALTRRRSENRSTDPKEDETHEP